MKEVKKNLKVNCVRYNTDETEFEGEAMPIFTNGKDYLAYYDSVLKKYVIEADKGENGLYMFDELKYKDSYIDYEFIITETDCSEKIKVGKRPCYAYNKEIDFEDEEIVFEGSIPEEVLKEYTESLEVQGDNSHYGDDDDVQVVDLLEAMGYAEGFYRGNIVKYVMRAGKKKGEDDMKDMMKALDYMEMEIARIMRLKNKNK